MPRYELDSAVLLTLGRSSSAKPAPGCTAKEGPLELTLAPAGAKRAINAAEIVAGGYNPSDRLVRFGGTVITAAIFAGGHVRAHERLFPDYAERLDFGEAALQASPTYRQLLNLGWTPEKIDSFLGVQDVSNTTIADIRMASDKGLLDPNDFHRNGEKHGIVLNMGGLHGIRARTILTNWGDIDPKLIVRAPMRDPYSSAAEVAQEVAAIAVNAYVFSGFKPRGDLYPVEERFNAIADRMTHV